MLKQSNMHDYQTACAAHILQKPACALFADMGLGKTVSTLTAVNTLMYHEAAVSKVLIVAPKRVAENVWDEEGQNWEHLNHLTFSKISGTEKQRLSALDKPADIYLLGRDNVAWLCGQYGGSMLPFDMLIIDESSSFKNHASVRFKALKNVRASFDRVLLLTGTPAPKGLLDLWAQMYLLDSGARLEKFITRYRKKYFTRGYDGFSYDLAEGSEPVIQRKIKDLCLSLKKKDFLKDLPGVVVNDVTVTFPANLDKKYRDFERDKVLEIFGGCEDEITAANAAALSGKLLQFTNGAVYDEDRTVHEVHSLKLDAAEEIVDSASGKPVLIFWNFRHDLDRLKLRFKDARELKTPQDMHDWNAGLIRVALLHPASGGHGLNLQKGGDKIVWFGLNWSLELYMQACARLDRQGKIGITYIHRIVARGTIDDRVAKSLSEKDRTQESLMAAVRDSIHKYLY